MLMKSNVLTISSLICMLCSFTCHAYNDTNTGFIDGKQKMGADSSSDNPKNYAETEYVTMNFYFNTHKRLSYKVRIVNLGSNDLKSVTVRTEIDNSVTDKSFTINPVLRTGESTVLTVNNVPNTNGLHKLNSAICKANGVTLSDPKFVSANYGSYDYGYPRVGVIEEKTSINEGWAPQGIETMKYVGANYPDWVLISVHDDDPMSLPHYIKDLSAHLPSQNVPAAVFNRINQFDLMTENPDTDEEIEDNYYYGVDSKIRAFPSFVSVDFDAAYVEDTKSVRIMGDVEMSQSGSIPLDLAFALVENRVGPYNQTNSYASQSELQLYGWENKSSSESIYCDNVAKAYVKVNDDNYVIPETFEEFINYPFDLTLALDDIKNDLFSVVAMVIHKETGEIMNAKKLLVSKTGIDIITGDTESDLRVENGYIITSDPNTIIYAPDGRHVNNGSLQQGIYIVSVNGKSKRVLVK